ncbi:MAG: M1 family metallopeptidase [Promethearchaeota archaeon]
MKPTHYLIQFEPDLDKFVFHGSTQIDLTGETSTSEIVLNAKELTIHSCKIHTSEIDLDCTFDMHAESEELHIHLPQPLSGEMSLHIEFDGIHNDNLYGFYRSRMTYDGKVTYMVTTQFEERDARAAFPCFDEPALKATFDIEYVIDVDLTGVANTAILDETPLTTGKKLVKFDRTPKMSTYLLYFGIGKFEIIEDTTKSPTLRMITAPGKSQYGKFALDIARKSFDYGEKFFQAPYPLSKCDFIVVEDFAAGAMENYGAITFRENLLLVYPGKTSKPQLVRIAQVVAHEITHMWFGDLVSPAKWKYLWLNESFATYFTYAIPDEYFPDWLSWEDLLGGRGLGGFRRDSLISTVPVELPGDEEISIDASSAPIIYAKGALVMRVLAGYLGEEKFFKGIRHFLNKHAFDAATSDDCWAAFEEASGEPITEFAHSWVNQLGYPSIKITKTGDLVNLEQHRFTLLPHESDTLWFIPVKIRIFKEDGSTEIMDVILKERSMEITLPAGTKTFKLNADQTGFYRVEYSLDHLYQLGELAKTHKLTSLDRFGLQSDYFNFMQKGAYSIKDYLAFLQNYYADEDSPVCLTDICSNLLRLEIIAKTQRESIHTAGRTIAEHALEKMGYLPADEDIGLVSEARSILLWMGGHFKSQKIISFATEYFQKLREGEMIPADIFQSVAKIGAEQYPDSWDFMATQVTDPNVPESVKQHWLAALACFTDRSLLEKSLELNLTKIAKLNRAQILVQVVLNPASQGWYWNYYHSNFQKLLEELPKSVLGNTLAFIPPLSAIENKEEVLGFLTKIGETMPPAKGLIDMGKEMAEIYVILHQQSQK